MLEARACCAMCGKDSGCFTVKASGQLLCFECVPPKPVERERGDRPTAAVIDFAIYRSSREIRAFRAS